jgi:hypothetical protein
VFSNPFEPFELGSPLNPARFKSRRFFKTKQENIKIKNEKTRGRGLYLKEEGHSSSLE